MKKSTNRFSLVLMLILLLITSLALPIHATTKIENLTSYIKQSLLESKEDIAQNPISTLTNSLYKVQKEFYQLPRHKLTYGELLEAKYLMQHWRFHTKEKLISSLAFATPSKQKSIVTLLARLDTMLSSEELDLVKKTLLQTNPTDHFDSNLWDRFDLLVQYQGDSDLARKYLHRSPDIPIGGPSKKLPIKPIDPSSWPFSKWSKIQNLGEYYRGANNEGPVYFRGHFFENGDIIVVNQFNDMDGVFSTFPKGPGSFSHAAIYVEMEKEGKKYPSVFEIHTQGTRFVPLNVFFSRTFISYAEIYRVQDGPSDWKKNLPAIIEDIDKRPHGYNLYAHPNYSKGDRYLTCTQLVEYILRQANALSDFNQCEIVPTAQKTLRKLGLTAKSVLTPTSFVKNPHLKMVGAFDSGTLKHNVAKEVVLSRFSHDIDNGHFVIENFQNLALYRLSEMYQTKIPWLAPTILRIGGHFTADSIPIGPIGILSMTLPLDQYSAKSLKRVQTELKDEFNKYLDQSSLPFLFSEFISDEKVEAKSKEIFLFMEHREEHPGDQSMKLNEKNENEQENDELDFTDFWF